MSEQKRKVVVYEYRRVAEPNIWDKVLVGPGFFLAFGVDYEQFDGVVGQYSTAIVEMPDGSVMNVPVHMIVFNN